MPTTSATTRRRSTVAVRGDLWTMGIFFSAELQTWRRRERATSGAIEVPRRLADLRYHMVPARRTKQVIPLVSEHIGQAIAHASADLDEGDVAAVDARVAQRLDAALMPSRKLPLGQKHLVHCVGVQRCIGIGSHAFTPCLHGARLRRDGRIIIRHSPRARSLPWALPQRWLFTQRFRSLDSRRL